MPKVLVVFVRSIVPQLAVLLAIAFYATGSTSFAQTVNLVGTQYTTFVDPDGRASRYTAGVEEAFRRMDTPLNIEVMRRAFMGSALLSNRADGHVAFIDLNERDTDRLYSESYATVELVLASREPKVTSVMDFSYIADERVATENRFANTAQLRPVENIRWSRNPTTFDMFKQVGDERADYLFADKKMVAEFNLMLAAAKRPVLFLGPNTLVTTSVHISLRKSLPNAEAIIAAFNQHIESMGEDGTLDTLLMNNGTSRNTTLLDSGRYQQLMRNW
jgi:ABC-type amino acid transport substrate-binding protein